MRGLVSALALLSLAAAPQAGSQTAVDSAVARFYEGRDQPAWVRDRALTAEAAARLETVAHADREGLQPTDYLTPELAALLGRAQTPEDVGHLDTLLTRAFFTYARDVSRGRIDPALLDEKWIASPERLPLTLAAAPPTHPGYRALRDALQRERDAARARVIAVNMERWRWLPPELGARHIMVNSATYTLQLIDGDSAVLTTRAIVGRPDWPTPIVSSRATGIMFRPAWYVPASIAEREIMPLVRRDPDYLRREGFEMAKGGQLVQAPGGSNPLGAMKLAVATPFDVFIHDTPARSLFHSHLRALSHGCIRIEQAANLAGHLLPTWPADSIRVAMVQGRERWAPLPEPVPVHLVYFTAWVASDGALELVEDVYGWDAKLLRRAAP